MPGSGCADSKRAFNDRLLPIKRALNEFVVKNEGLGPRERVKVNFSTLQAKALKARDEILELLQLLCTLPVECTLAAM